jgi:hypothetical protein
MKPQASLEDENKNGEREPEKEEEIGIGQFYMNINYVRDKPQMFFLLLFSMIFRQIKVA